MTTATSDTALDGVEDHPALHGAPRRRGTGAATARRLAAAITVALLPLTSTVAQDPDAAAKALVARYVATWDVDALLAEPAIRSELQALLGPRLADFRRALSTNSGVEYAGGGLAVAGNAPRQGGANEAVVCINVFAAKPQVHAAIAQGGKVTVYTRQKRWDFLPTCIRDWATLATLGRDARLKAPAGVQMNVKP